MHPRNPYTVPPDFPQLAEAYPALQPHLIHTANGVTINFQDHISQRCLTEALLSRDFGITLTIPEDRLCPPVPNRLNYILWLQDILTYMQDYFQDLGDNAPTGIDIGTGASTIYPLLGCSIEPTWRFIATDIDERSVQFAKENVARNNLQNRITVVHVDTNGPIFPPQLLAETGPSSPSSSYEFTMCNPPFYGSRQEITESAGAKEFAPNAVCMGADNEMITPGGEAAFVRRMIAESSQLRTRCRWYTSMLGKMSSLTEIVDLLREEKVDNYAITEFIQGRTRRWAIAWSFTDVRLPDSLSRIQNPSLATLMPPRNTLMQTFSCQASTDVQSTLAQVLAGVEGVTTQVNRNENGSQTLVAHAGGDTWSRAARRKKLKTNEAPTGASPPCVQLICAMRVGSSSSGAGPYIEFQWVRGRDRSLYESFMSHVGRKVAAALASA